MKLSVLVVLVQLVRRREVYMIILDMSDKRPLYEQILSRFKEMIEKGILAKDEQMPSVRALSMDLSINPNTIQRAYTELEREGYIYSVKGRGSFVADISNLMPKRVEEFYEELNILIEKSTTYGIARREIIRYIEEFDKRGGKP